MRICLVAVYISNQKYLCDSQGHPLLITLNVNSGFRTLWCGCYSRVVA
jgi:hypothetical protein